MATLGFLPLSPHRDIPEDGLLFFLPLDSDLVDAAGGRAVEWRSETNPDPPFTPGKGLPGVEGQPSANPPFCLRYLQSLLLVVIPCSLGMPSRQATQAPTHGGSSHQPTSMSPLVKDDIWSSEPHR